MQIDYCNPVFEYEKASRTKKNKMICLSVIRNYRDQHHIIERMKIEN